MLNFVNVIPGSIQPAMDLGSAYWYAACPYYIRNSFKLRKYIVRCKKRSIAFRDMHIFLLCVERKLDTLETEYAGWIMTMYSTASCWYRSSSGYWVASDDPNYSSILTEAI